MTQTLNEFPCIVLISVLTVVFLVFVHRCSGHFWLWGLWDQQLWAVLHQLCKRTAAILLQPPYFQSGAGNSKLCRMFVKLEDELKVFWSLDRRRCSVKCTMALWLLKSYHLNYFVLPCFLQEEYQAEGITWHNIDYTDNVGCIHLISKKPTGLLYLLDEESK